MGSYVCLYACVHPIVQLHGSIEAKTKNGNFESGVVHYDDLGHLQDNTALLKMYDLHIGTYVTWPGFLLQSLFVHVWL